MSSPQVELHNHLLAEEQAISRNDRIGDRYTELRQDLRAWSEALQMADCLEWRPADKWTHTDAEGVTRIRSIPACTTGAKALTALRLGDFNEFGRLVNIEAERRLRERSEQEVDDAMDDERKAAGAP